MIELGLTDAAALGNVANRLDPIPVIGDEFDRGLQRLVKRNGGGRHLRQDLLQNGENRLQT